jgi:hypothetical protein
MERFENTAVEQANFLASCASQVSRMKRTSEAVSPQSCSSVRTVAGRKKRLFPDKTVTVMVDSDVLDVGDDIRDLFERPERTISTATTIHRVEQRRTERVAVDAIGEEESARLRSAMTTYSAFVEALVSHETIYNLLIDRLAKDIYLQAAELSCRNKSVLRQKGFEELNNFSLEPVIAEFSDNMPILSRLMLAAMANDKHKGLQYVRDHADSDLSKKLCFAYGILMQGRCMQLSLMQCLVTCLLMDSICDSKVSKLHLKHD